MIENYSDESLSPPKNISDHDTIDDFIELKAIVDWFNEEGKKADIATRSDKQMRINQLLMKHLISPGNSKKFNLFRQKVEAAYARLNPIDSKHDI